MADITEEIREHIGHQWSDRSFVQSEKVRDIMRRAADEIERLRAGLLAAKIPHLYVEDTWYACPKNPEGCSNEGVPKDECDCGADAHNAAIDKLLE